MDKTRCYTWTEQIASPIVGARPRTEETEDRPIERPIESSTTTVEAQPIKKEKEKTEEEKIEEKIDEEYIKKMIKVREEQFGKKRWEIIIYLKGIKGRVNENVRKRLLKKYLKEEKVFIEMEIRKAEREIEKLKDPRYATLKVYKDLKERFKKRFKKSVVPYIEKIRHDIEENIEKIPPRTPFEYWFPWIRK